MERLDEIEQEVKDKCRELRVISRELFPRGAPGDAAHGDTVAMINRLQFRLLEKVRKKKNLLLKE